MSSEPCVQLVVALAAEARPLIQAFGLARSNRSGPFPCYQAPGWRLVVSGIGKLESAAACGVLHGQGAAPGAWLNVGLAGHGHLPVGTACLAHRVDDLETGRSHYPQWIGPWPCTSSPLRTVTAASNEIPYDSLQDMEAAGFCQVAGRLSRAELVHVFKVVSDNPERGFEHVTPRLGGELIERHLSTIMEISATLAERARQVAARSIPRQQLARYFRRWRFSATQRAQLERLLGRWRALAPDAPDPIETVENARDARAVLALLTENLPPSMLYSVGDERP